MADWDPEGAWRRAQSTPDGWRDNPQWLAARKAARAAPGLRAEVDLDWQNATEGHCVACGSWAYTSWQGHPIHMTCAVDVALVLEMTKRQKRLGGPSLLEDGGPLLEGPA